MEILSGLIVKWQVKIAKTTPQNANRSLELDAGNRRRKAHSGPRRMMQIIETPLLRMQAERTDPTDALNLY